MALEPRRTSVHEPEAACGPVRPMGHAADGPRVSGTAGVDRRACRNRHGCWCRAASLAYVVVCADLLVFGFAFVPAGSNARGEPRPKAGAQRTLEGVGSSA